MSGSLSAGKTEQSAEETNSEVDFGSQEEVLVERVYFSRRLLLCLLLSNQQLVPGVCYISLLLLDYVKRYQCFPTVCKDRHTQRFTPCLLLPSLFFPYCLRLCCNVVHMFQKSHVWKLFLPNTVVEQNKGHLKYFPCLLSVLRSTTQSLLEKHFWTKSAPSIYEN